METFGNNKVTECLRYALGTERDEESIKRVLEYVGKCFGSERTYIHETQDGIRFSNTYEWCAFGANLSKADKEITCLLRDNGKVIGIMGITNPAISTMEDIGSFLEVLEYFVVSFLKRRDLLAHLEYVSYHDRLTGALNRSAYTEREAQMRSADTAGIIYADVTGLKRTNDQQGHRAGDAVLCVCADLMKTVFGEDGIFRMGGDEFLIYCENVSKEEFEEKCVSLCQKVEESNCTLAIGSAWGNPKQDFDEMFRQAETDMYQKKREYYCGVDTVTGERRDRRSRR